MSASNSPRLEVEDRDESRVVEASDPQTSPKRLSAIFNEKPSAHALRALASNPNTPTELLWKLAARLPREVLDNPVLVLLHLEDANLGNTISFEAAMGFLTVGELPAWMLKAFGRNPQGDYHQAEQAREAIAMHVQTKGEAGPGWKRGVTAAINNLVKSEAGRFSSPYGLFELERLERALQLRVMPDWLCALLMTQFDALARRTSVAEEGAPMSAAQAKRELSSDAEGEEPSEEGRSREAMSRRALRLLRRWRETAEARAHSGDPANAPRLSEADLRRMAHKTQGARRRLLALRLPRARNEDADGQTLRLLAQSDERSVRMAVARNPKTPRDALETLAGDDDAWVRGALARNRELPPALLSRLAKDEDGVVRANVARHRQTPQPVLLQLARDEDGEVLSALKHRAHGSPELAEVVARRQQEVRDWGRSRPPLQLARDPQTPPETLSQLAAMFRPEFALRSLDPRQVATKDDLNDGDDPETQKQKRLAIELRADAVLRRVGVHPKTPVETLQQLADDNDVDVRCAVASNRATPPETLHSLSLDAVDQVRARALANPRTPLDRLLQAASEKGAANFGTPNSVSSLARREALASNPALPPDALETLFETTRVGFERSMSQSAWNAPPQPTTYSYGYGYNRERTEEALLREEFCLAIARHPHASRSLRARARRLQQEVALWEFSESENHFERVLALASEFTPVEILRANLSAPQWLWRVALARNPGAPRDLLETLATDGHRFVRATAKERLKGRYGDTESGKQEEEEHERYFTL